MKKHSITFLSISIALLFIGFYGCSKDSSPVASSGPSVTKIYSNGSIVPNGHTSATGSLFITDQNGSPISGLTSSNVSAKLKWGTFDNPTDSATSVVTVTSNSSQGKNVAGAITMDLSGSMGDEQINCMENGVKAYINSMKTDDKTEIIKFSDAVAVVQAFSNNKNLLINADTTYWSGTGGSTALYQSIFQGINDAVLQTPSMIRSVIAFTDGGENASTVSRDQMISNALTNGIPVYTVFLAIDTTYYPAEYYDMKNIADTTGGFNFWVKPDSCSNLTRVYNTISGQLVGSYSVAITWQGTLPPSGTVVYATITTNYNNLVSTFTRSFVMQ